jgi:TspO/MBR family
LRQGARGSQKPSFNPPNAIFGPVWTALYLLSFAFWRILRLPAEKPGRELAIVLFIAQLALNALWSFLFFGAHSPLIGLRLLAAPPNRVARARPARRLGRLCERAQGRDPADDLRDPISSLAVLMNIII